MRLEPSAPRLTLSALAATWCQSEQFFQFITAVKGFQPLEGETRVITCKRYVLEACEITSRRELDTSKIAANVFGVLIRKPYQTYLEGLESRKAG